MAPLAPPDQNRLVEAVGQSQPVDLSRPYDPSTLRGKTILVTGGSSGLGAAFARHWAAHGANLIVGDINDAAGEALVAELRTLGGNDDDNNNNPKSGGGGGSTSGDGDGDDGGSSSSSSNTTTPQNQNQNQNQNRNRNNNHHHHFIHVDVTSWPSQAALFQQAARLSPAGHLDAVVASAGVSDRHGAATGMGFENPSGLDAPDPPAPDLRCVGVNLIGMMYTAHLALFWLRRDGGGGGGGSGSGTGTGTGDEDKDDKEKKTDRTRDRTRDRHFLMIGSYAGLTPCTPGVPEYVTSKHAVTGLFRSLRTLSRRGGRGGRGGKGEGEGGGVRVNLLCPYFVDTPILGNQAMALLAGMALARLEDVVDAATRFMADDGNGSSSGGGDGSGSGSGSGSGRISGRALVVGPRLSLLKGGKDVLVPRHERPAGRTEQDEATARDGDGGGGGEDEDEDEDVLVDEDVRRGRGQAVWECYAHDYDTVDYFTRRYIRVLNTVAAVRGWVGWAGDLFHALFVRRGP